jgi:ferredoxin-type protein NapF
MERRELFTSLLKPFKGEEDKGVVIRPPYFKDVDSFYKECINCDGDCSTLCEENIIIIGEDKTPFIDFKQGGCTYCDECAIACPHDVLNIEDKSHINVSVEINMLECLSWKETMCFSCKDPCLDNAIHFTGMFRPIIDETQCTSCGFCVNVCPTDAINIKGKKNAS